MSSTTASYLSISPRILVVFASPIPQSSIAISLVAGSLILAPHHATTTTIVVTSLRRAWSSITRPPPSVRRCCWSRTSRPSRHPDGGCSEPCLSRYFAFSSRLPCQLQWRAGRARSRRNGVAAAAGNGGGATFPWKQQRHCSLSLSLSLCAGSRRSTSGCGEHGGPPGRPTSPPCRNAARRGGGRRQQFRARRRNIEALCALSPLHRRPASLCLLVAATSLPPLSPSRRLGRVAPVPPWRRSGRPPSPLAVQKAVASSPAEEGLRKPAAGNFPLFAS